MALLAWLCLLLAVIGLAQGLAGLAALWRFAALPAGTADTLPGMSVLKPLYGSEPLLGAALASVAAQNYPDFEIIAGVHTETDAAVPVIRDVQARFPARRIALVVDPASHGSNGKVDNLINMLPAVRHDVLVIGDSDMHLPPGFLRAVAATLAGDTVGLATSLYVGKPAHRGLAGRLGALQIDQYFLPGALLARALGRQDCFGATMALRRDVLDRAGGLAALRDELADDAVLGRNVAALGLRIALIPMIPATTVTESSLGALWRHEVRWARTMRSLAPGPYAASLLQYPLVFAALGALAAWPWAALGLFVLAWAVRAGLALAAYPLLRRASDGLATPPAILLLPLREVLSAAVLLAAFAGRKVVWRGQEMLANPPSAAPIGNLPR